MFVILTKVRIHRKDLIERREEKPLRMEWFSLEGSYLFAYFNYFFLISIVSSSKDILCFLSPVHSGSERFLAIDFPHAVVFQASQFC